MTREARWLAAVLSQGQSAALSHASAAALWCIRASSAATIEVTVAARSGRRAPHRVRLHRVQTLTEGQATTLDAIPVTTPARTLADLAPRLSATDLERAVEESERRGLFDLALVREATDGRPSGRRLLAACAAADPLSSFTRSELERRFLALCRDHGLPIPAVNAWVSGHEVDFLWRAAGLIAETDGYEFHSTPTAIERDRRRELELRTAGYEVVRVSYRQVADIPGEVADSLRDRLVAAA